MINFQTIVAAWISLYLYQIHCQTSYNVTNPNNPNQTFTISTPVFGETHTFFEPEFNNMPPMSTTFHKGMTFVSDRYCPNVTFGSEEALYSLKQIYSTGVEWVSVVVTEYQTNTSSHDIHPVYTPIYLPYYTHLTASVSNLTFIIKAAHRIGLRVLLKPHIDLLSDRAGPWRGDIYPQDLEKWFKSYTKMISKYAALAEALNVEMFNIATELQSLTGNTDQWRQVIKTVRSIFKGSLISSANYGGEEQRTQFWDDLDNIGVDAYYFNWVMANKTLDDIIKAWDGPMSIMKDLSLKFNKPVIITEMGYCSGNCIRSEEASEYKLNAQAQSYEALLILQNKHQDWLKGVYWWSWNSDPAFGGENDICISPQYKPAEAMIRRYWGGKDTLPKPEYPAQCLCTV